MRTADCAILITTYIRLKTWVSSTTEPEMTFNERVTMNLEIDKDILRLKTEILDQERSFN